MMMVNFPFNQLHTCLQEKNELAPVTHKRHRKSSWAMSGSGMILATRRSGAMKRALDIKSHFLVKNKLTKIMISYLSNFWTVLL